MSKSHPLQVTADGYGRTHDEVDFWVQHRSALKDLYRSETHFLIPALREAQHVLDIGCAAGGSALFTREVNPESKYTGIDISANMVSTAEKRFHNLPRTRFIHFDGNHIPLDDSETDLAFSLGVFHHLPQWQELMREALRVSSKYVLFDLRLWSENTVIDPQLSYQKLALSGNWDGSSIVPYNLIALNDFFKVADSLKSEGIQVDSFGYFQPPTQLAVTPAKKVLMTSVLLKKNVPDAKVTMTIT